jgi:predicted RNase H-like HicB family nuclease
MNIDKNLHVLLIEDKDKKLFFAHCLDMNIASQGKTADEAVAELKELIVVQIEYCLEHDMLDTLFRLAPKAYRDMYYRSQANRVVNQLSLHNKHIIKDLTRHLEFAYA